MIHNAGTMTGRLRERSSSSFFVRTFRSTRNDYSIEVGGSAEFAVSIEIGAFFSADTMRETDMVLASNLKTFHTHRKFSLVERFERFADTRS